MALDPAVLEARIHWRELRVLAAQTAVDWGAQASEREFAKMIRKFSRGLPLPPAYRGSDPDEA